ncbi:MAG: N6-L-threonylcarbamoyladenine synthase, partial [Oceanicoccus sp.]
MKILAIESSCDETAVAIIENGWKVHCNIIASQIEIHSETGGVVPEVASREHMKAILPTIRAALKEAKMSWDDIDTIAVTKEPGLIGSVLVGRMTAAALSFALEKPLIEVNHIHGHLYSNWLSRETAPQYPILSLTVSGGHN